MPGTRDAVAELFDKMTAAGGAGPEEEIEPAGAEAASAAGEVATESTAEAQGSDEEAAAQRARDERGRFAKAEAEKAAAGKAPGKGAADKGKPAVAAGATVEKPAGAAAEIPAGAAAEQGGAELKPPADWRPAAKEVWGKLPRVAQEEALRLHVETRKVLDQSSQARQVAETFQRTVAPYEHMFRAAGRSPIDGVNYLLQSYAQLQTAPLPQRAALLGGLVRDFLGTDEGAINLLAQALEGKGQGGPAGGAAPAAAIRPEQIQQLVRTEAQRIQAEAQQQGEAKAISDFEATQPEFLGNVLQEMLALATVEKRAGKAITVDLLKQLHVRALRMNSETAAILKQRDDAKAVKDAAEKAKKDAAAASSVKDEPAGPAGSEKAVTTRDEVQKQWNRLATRR